MDYAPLGNSKLDFERLVQQGKAQRVLPNTDTGYKSYGTGRLFLPAGTNYCTNPSMETDAHTNTLADGWDASSSTVTGTIVYSKVAGRLGGTAQRVQYTGVAGDAAGKIIYLLSKSADGSFATGDTVCGSAYHKGVLSGCNGLLIVQQQNVGETGGDTNTVAYTPSGVWERSSTTKTSTTADMSKARILVCVTDIHEGDVVDLTIDDVLIEKSSVLTPYFDGTHDNCVWTGTANASTSTRTLSTLTYTLPFSSTNRGTVAIQHNPIYASTYTGTPGLWYLVMSGFGIWAYWGGLGYWSGQISDGNDWLHGFIPSGSCTEFGVGQNSPSVYRWDEARCGSAQLGTTVSTLNSHDMNLATTSKEFKFSPVYTTRFATGSTRNTIVSPSAKSDSWVTAILANSGAAFNDPMRLWRDFMEPGDVLFPLTEDSVGYQKIVNIGSGTPTGLDATFTTTAATTDTGYEVYDG